MMTVIEIVEVIGRAHLASRLDVGRAAISNAISDEIFPAKWYRIVKSECDQAEISCPLSCFNFAWIKLPAPQSDEAA